MSWTECADPREEESDLAMNNPAVLLARAMGMGQDPKRMMEKMAAQDPRISQALSMIRGKSTQQLEQMARNMARERGTSVEDIARSIGLSMK